MPLYPASCPAGLIRYIRVGAEPLATLHRLRCVEAYLAAAASLSGLSPNSRSTGLSCMTSSSLVRLSDVLQAIHQLSSCGSSSASMHAAGTLSWLWDQDAMRMRTCWYLAADLALTLRTAKMLDRRNTMMPAAQASAGSAPAAVSSRHAHKTGHAGAAVMHFTLLRRSQSRPHCLQARLHPAPSSHSADHTHSSHPTGRRTAAPGTPPQCNASAGGLGPGQPMPQPGEAARGLRGGLPAISRRSPTLTTQAPSLPAPDPAMGHWGSLTSRERVLVVLLPTVRTVPHRPGLPPALKSLRLLRLQAQQGVAGLDPSTASSKKEDFGTHSSSHQW